MDELVARLNIDHFRKALAKADDKSKQRTLLRLLAEEEAKLAMIESLVSRQRAGVDIGESRRGQHNLCCRADFVAEVSDQQSVALSEVLKCAI